MSSKLSATTVIKKNIIPTSVLGIQREVKKLLSVSTTSIPVIETKEKMVEAAKTVETARAGKGGEKSKIEYPENLAQVPCIRYPITFQKKFVPVLLFFDSGSEVNAIHPTCARELDLFIRPTDVGTQKIDGTTLDIFGIVVATFSMTNKANRIKFFEKIFLVANINPEVVFEILFLTLNGADVDFLSQKLWWRTYTTKEALPTIRRIKLMGKKEFAVTALDPRYKTYLIYVRSVNSNALPRSSLLNVYPSWKPQISGLITKKASTKVLANHSDFADIFTSDLASELAEHTEINNHAIELVDG